MKLLYYARRALQLPPGTVVRIAWGLATGRVSAALRKRRLAKQPSRTPIQRFAGAGPKTFLEPVSAGKLLPFAPDIRRAAEAALEHRFDLLGSGPVQVFRGMECAGVEGYRIPAADRVTVDDDGSWITSLVNAANAKESARIYRQVKRPYVPIDWQIDFKSGFRWSERLHHSEIAYGQIPGVDVKVPWELARMQHLPMLAWAFLLASSGETGFRSPADYLTEFENQILDFAASNPPGYGVNWKCAMDVGIRIANWLVAYDIFESAGAPLHPTFREELVRSAYDHGIHILENLEWSRTLRSNHYLADIVGLLFVAAYVPESAETDAWLRFALQEFLKEVKSQFQPDGSNFEASSAYHRLSGEMVVYGTAVTLALPRERMERVLRVPNSALKAGPGIAAPFPVFPDPWDSPFDREHLQLLEGISAFAAALARPDGRAVQFGDNDSGRFLKMLPVSSSLENGVEEFLDFRHLIGAASGLTGSFASSSGPFAIEGEIVRSFIRLRPEVRGSVTARARDVPHDEGLFNDLLIRAQTVSGEKRVVSEFHSRGQLLDGIRITCFPDFGAFVFRSSTLYAAVRCGSVGQLGNGGHAHNDQLGLELWLDGKPVVVDPGTYLYTPIPAQRNAYRSVRAHFAPCVPGHEPADLSRGLFTLGNPSPGSCLYAGSRGFAGVHSGYGRDVWRVIEILETTVRVTDFSEELAIGKPQPDHLPFSRGYGIRAAE